LSPISFIISAAVSAAEVSYLFYLYLSKKIDGKTFAKLSAIKIIGSLCQVGFSLGGAYIGGLIGTLICPGIGTYIGGLIGAILVGTIG
jgi:outer membrane lipoprotein SlyB